MNDATWPTFIAAPFIVPEHLDDLLGGLDLAPLGGRAAAVLVARQVGGLGGVVARGRPPASPPTFAVRRIRPVGIELSSSRATRQGYGANRLPPACGSSPSTPATARRRGSCSTARSSPCRARRRRRTCCAPGRSTGSTATGEPAPLASVALLPPVPRPGKIVCIGLNYRSHAAEQGAEPPETPTIFAKFANALAAPGAAVPLPPLQREGGLRGRGGVRDRRRCKDVPRPTRSRTWPATCCSTTCRRATTSSRPRSGCPARSSTAPLPAARRSSRPTRRAPPDAIEIALTLNGEEMQYGSTADLIHSVPALVALPLDADDARARRHRLHRHPGRRRQPARPARVAEARRRGRDQLAAAGRARHPARLRPADDLDLAVRSAAASRSALRRADQMATLGSPARPPPPAAPARCRRPARTRATDWSRLRSSCSASRITPHSTSSRSAVALALERAER